MLSIETGQVTQLTSPGAPQFDGLAAMAPDGKTLAFQRYLGPPSVWTLMLLTLPRPPQPAGELKQIGLESVESFGRGIIRLVCRRPGNHLPEGPRPLGFSGGSPLRGILHPNGCRLREKAPGIRPQQPDAAIDWCFPVPLTRSTSGRWHWTKRGVRRVRPSLPSSPRGGSLCPAFSPDGTKVAFQSNRSGSNQVWVCRSNGSDCSEVTQFVGQHAGSPAWSPNGKWISFDGSNPTDLPFTSSARMGAGFKRLAAGVVPRWSRDGQWIYYSRSRPQQLYRVASTGGDPEAVSGTAEGWVPEESPDRQWIYYSGHPVAGWDQPAKSAFARRRSDRRVSGAGRRKELCRYEGRNLVHDAQPQPEGRQPAAVLRLCLQAAHEPFIPPNVQSGQA